MYMYVGIGKVLYWIIKDYKHNDRAIELLKLQNKIHRQLTHL